MTATVSEEARERAELYRLLHVGTPGDVVFYVAACAGADRVLELGCGAGRVTVPVAASGPAVVGLDRDAALLALAGEAVGAELASRVTLVLGDMTDFAFETRFDRVLIPFTGLFALEGPEAIARCFACVRRHLAPGGVLIFDTYAVDEDECGPREPWDSGFAPTLTLSRGGGPVRVLERNVATGEPGRVDVTYVFELPGADGGERLVEQHIRHHFVSWPVLDALLDEAGFAEATVRGGFDGAPFDDQSEQMVVLAST